jgi:GH15 family glucan-1,4-alpha-glucosidase
MHQDLPKDENGRDPLAPRLTLRSPDEPILGLAADDGPEEPVERLDEIFPPIADYAYLSDCENSCLIAPTGAVEWLCLPLPHDPSVFGTVLDRSAGSFRLGPADVAVPASRRYLPGTNILETTWQTRAGWLVVEDFLAVSPWHRTADRSSLHRRTPGDFDAQHVLVRIATCLYGSAELTLDCELAFNYGQTDASWEYAGPSYGQVATTTPEFMRLQMASDLRLGVEGRAVRARHRLEQGESCFIVFSWSHREPPTTIEDAMVFRRDTERFWRSWLGGGTFPDHPWRERLQRSALTLKGLTYASTGALLAAPTTSLPEWPGGSRNWDYRYTWVRDASFTLWALHALGFDAEADDFLAFLSDVILTTDGPPAGEARRPSSPRIQVLYGVDGSTESPERELEHLSGYAGSRPVRVGNAAYAQEQFDIYGTIVDCVYQHTKSRDALTERSWRIVVAAVEAALEHWREPDRGIWEVRGEPKHFTSSKVMCWVAADRGARLAALRGDRGRASRWAEAAVEIRADILEHALDEKGRFTQYYGSDELDASLLLLPLVRFLPPDDERLRATVLAIADELCTDGLVVRYRAARTDDGLEDPEASFTACSFWLVSALAEIGETFRARQLCERLLSSASDLGLYAEELDGPTGRHYGNFPQALTHLALVNAALHVIEAEQGGPDGPSRGGDLMSPPTWWDAADSPWRAS